MQASNRQKKILRFFKIPFSPNISSGAAGWDIGTLMGNDEYRIEWEKYLYLTNDFSSETDKLIPYDELEFAQLEIPNSWSSSVAMQKHRDEFVSKELLQSDNSPFDRPQPPIEFLYKSFVFTGKFSFGSRKTCQQAVIERGGQAPSKKSVSRNTDYLVIGCEGSRCWKKGAYGNKIESAIISRREHGSPSIVSEEHWVSCLGIG